MWQSLATITRPAWDTARRAPPGAPPVREAAAAIALRTWGENRVMALPELVNIAALAWCARARIVVHDLRPAVARLVAETDLHALPAEPPALLRGAWIVEAQRPERGERLFGDCASLGGYALEDAIYLIGLGYPDGAYVARWMPQWTGEELAAGLPSRDTSPLIDDVDRHHAWARQAARFAVVLSLLLEATGAPIREGDATPPARRGRVSERDAVEREWSVRRLYVDAPQVVRTVPVTRADGGAGDVGSGRTAAEVTVRGHLRRQPHGPGGTLRRWQWVEGYAARRWVAPASRVIVGRRTP